MQGMCNSIKGLTSDKILMSNLSINIGIETCYDHPVSSFVLTHYFWHEDIASDPPKRYSMYSWSLVDGKDVSSCVLLKVQSFRVSMHLHIVLLVSMAFGCLFHCSHRFQFVDDAVCLSLDHSRRTSS